MTPENDEYNAKEIVKDYVESGKPLDPYKTICVVKHKGKEVGRIPAAAKNAAAYMTELAIHYGGVTVDYEPDTTDGLSLLIHGSR